MLYWDQCTKPIKWFPSSLMVTSLPFLMLQNYPNFWFYPYANSTHLYMYAIIAMEIIHYMRGWKPPTRIVSDMDAMFFCIFSRALLYCSSCLGLMFFSVDLFHDNDVKFVQYISNVMCLVKRTFFIAQRGPILLCSSCLGLMLFSVDLFHDNDVKFVQYISNVMCLVKRTFFIAPRGPILKFLFRCSDKHSSISVFLWYHVSLQRWRVAQ